MQRTWMDRCILAMVLLLAWQGVATALGSYWISSPVLVAGRIWTLLANGDLWFHARFTIAEALAGFLLGAAPGCLLAMSLRGHPLIEMAVESVAAIGYAVPKTALVPLFILWLGVGPAAKVALVASAIFFIVFYSTLRGVKAVDERLLLSARVLGASDWQLLHLVVWPAVVPYVFGGLRVAVPYAVAGAIVGEIISSNRGLGYLAQYGAMDFDTTLIFVALVTVMLIVLAISWALGRVQRSLLRWQAADSEGARGVVGA